MYRQDIGYSVINAEYPFFLAVGGSVTMMAFECALIYQLVIFIWIYECHFILNEKIYDFPKLGKALFIPGIGVNLENMIWLLYIIIDVEFLKIRIMGWIFN